jgi:uncharacterized protein with PIN domain
MDQQFMEQAFPQEMQRRKENRCPFCNKEIQKAEFRDEASIREHAMSGLCQKCQDETFGA